MSNFSDASIISSIKTGGRALEAAMSYLYLKHACRGQIFAFILKRNGSREDAEDIFQDGIRLMIMQVRAGKFEAKGELSGYLFGICKNLWFKRFKKIARIEGLGKDQGSIVPDDSTPELDMLNKDRQEQIKELLSGLGEACQKVLELWQLSYSMKEIAEEMGYKTEGVARKKKRLCLKKLLDFLEESPAWKTWLKG